MQPTRILAAVVLLVAVSIVRVHGASCEPDRRTVNCLKCHPELKKQIDKERAHAPVKKGRCLSCHNPHATNVEKLLVEPREQICLRCHVKLAASLGSDRAHEPARRGECLKCHRPHSSPRPHLLVAREADLCANCHDSGGYLTKAVIHGPTVKGGQCSSCHDAHASRHPYLLEKRERQLCLSCHKVGELKGRRGHAGFDVMRVSCRSCHSPHSSDRKGLLRANLHEPFEKGQCNRCHAGRISSGRMVKTDERLCLDCHKGVEKDFQQIFRHVQGPRRNYCIDCHAPHGSDEAALRRGNDKAICFGCHEDTKWLMEGPGRAIKHPLCREGKCTACHRPHGSDNRLFFVGDEETTCSKCHTHQGKFRHPIGSDAPDPRSKRDMTCISCHDPMGAKYPYNLIFDRRRELCIQCHKR